ncbi:MAG: septum formation protein Maf [Clostridia bacterium]|jgi:septum formation protein|nr:septum formation protein Maf [Clostridia bacterium]
MKLILASQSPRRHDILGWMGIPFETDICTEPEILPEQLTARDTVMHLALQKATFVQRKHPGDYILGADTVVEFNGRILGKPHSKEQAIEYLSMLQENTHTVFTGVALLHGDTIDVRCCETEVTFCPMTDTEIRWYVQTGEPLDKAGAYGLQGLGSVFVQGMKGNYFNVIGLPAPMVYRMLLENGFLTEDRTFSE